MRSSAVKALTRCHRPGNIRELENCIERAILTREHDAIRSEHLPPSLQTIKKNDTTARPSLTGIIANKKRELIVDARKKCGGQQRRVAQELGHTIEKLQQWRDDCYCVCSLGRAWRTLLRDHARECRSARRAEMTTGCLYLLEALTCLISFQLRGDQSKLRVCRWKSGGREIHKNVAMPGCLYKNVVNSAGGREAESLGKCMKQHALYESQLSTAGLARGLYSQE
jgi:hypothetical protein